MTRHFGLSASYNHKRSDFVTPRTQQEAGIDHLEWEREPMSWGMAIFGLLAFWFCVIGLVVEAVLK